ncbi:hypothetical protein BKI52_36060 [marine bacterium AO1-C]|nr:hypothetical protein BKI52_36060 [marine bacterium AO1-C]
MKQTCKLTYWVVFLLWQGTQAYAQANTPKCFYKILVGKINKQLSVRMHLTKSRSQITHTDNVFGDYYYTKIKGGEIDLNGIWKDNGEVILNEKYGRFSGRWNPIDKVLVGMWTSDGKKALPFRLHEKYDKGSIKAEMICLDEKMVMGAKAPAWADAWILYPKFKGGKPEVANKLNQFIQEKILLKKPSDIIKSQVEKQIQHKKIAGVKSAHKKTITILHNKSNVLTLVVMDDPTYENIYRSFINVSYYSFDLNTGRRFNLEDIFIDGTQAKIQPLIVAAFRKEKKLKAGESLKKEGFFSEDFAVSRNFYFSVKGVFFFYGIREICYYYAGPQATTISYNKLKKYIKKDSPLDRYLR